MADKGMVVYLVRLFIERALGLLLFLLGSGWVLGARGALWFAVYFAAIGTVVWLYRAAPETMAARLSIADSKDVTPVWDKVLLAIFWLLAYFVVYWVAGRTCDPAQAIDAIAVLGAVIYLLSSMLTAWALSENRYAEAVSRVQEERGQRVCSTGPYAFVRHPMYSAILMWCVSVVMVFPSVWVALVSGAVAVVIVVRTALEDTMLAGGLAGYPEYQKKVRWRLVPFVW
ncbi:MAG: isoprenylcysteine carboxylmethyltransferase family protein [Atopobiaceae bacterium]|nr:isoprenylcysteine carboxylmethyltransferase family protein [Atopobiaceae bacterium]